MNAKSRATLGALAFVAGKDALKSAPKTVQSVVDAFVLGIPRRSACKVPRKGGHRDPGSCKFTTDGSSLSAAGDEIATRDGSMIRVCIPPGVRSPEARVSASAILHRLRTGLGIREAFTGKDQRAWRLSAGGKARASVPECINVTITAAMRKDSAAALKKHTKQSAAAARRDSTLTPAEEDRDNAGSDLNGLRLF